MIHLFLEFAICLKKKTIDKLISCDIKAFVILSKHSIP